MEEETVKKSTHAPVVHKQYAFKYVRYYFTKGLFFFDGNFSAEKFHGLRWRVWFTDEYLRLLFFVKLFGIPLHVLAKRKHMYTYTHTRTLHFAYSIWVRKSCKVHVIQAYIFVDEITKIKKERKKNTTSNDLNMSNLFLAEKKNAICFVISMQNAHVEHCSVEMSL